MKIKIVFATEIGTTKYVAEILKDELQKQDQTVDSYWLGSDGYTPTLDESDLVLLGSPTYYSGQPPTDMQKFLTSFKGQLKDKKIAVFCLGDSGYADFCGAAKVLEEWISQHKAQLLLPTLKIDGYPTDTAPIRQWANSLLGNKS